MYTVQKILCGIAQLKSRDATTTLHKKLVIIARSRESPKVPNSREDLDCSSLKTCVIILVSVHKFDDPEDFC
jgi:hypothetical protein